MSNLYRNYISSAFALLASTLLVCSVSFADATLTNVHQTTAQVDGFGQGFALIPQGATHIAAVGMPTGFGDDGGVSFRTTTTATATELAVLRGATDSLLGENIVEYAGGIFVSSSEEKAFYYIPPAEVANILSATSTVTISSLMAPVQKIMKIEAPTSTGSPATAAFSATSMALSYGIGSTPDLLIVSDPDRSIPYVYFYDAGAILTASTNPTTSVFARVHEIAGAAGDQTGYSLAADGVDIAYSSPNAFTGLGQVDVIERQSSAPYVNMTSRVTIWNPHFTTGSKFGQALDIRDGHLAVAAPYENTPSCTSCSNNGTIQYFQKDVSGSTITYPKRLDVGTYEDNALAGLGMGILATYNPAAQATQYRVQVGAPSETQIGIYSSFHIAEDSTPASAAYLTSFRTSWPMLAQLGRKVHSARVDVDGDGKTNDHFAISSPVVLPNPDPGIRKTGYMEQFSSKFETEPGNTSASVSYVPHIPPMMCDLGGGGPTTPPGKISLMVNEPVTGTQVRARVHTPGLPVDGSYTIYIFAGEPSAVPSGISCVDNSGQWVDVFPYQQTFMWSFKLNACAMNPAGPGCSYCNPTNPTPGCTPTFIKRCPVVSTTGSLTAVPFATVCLDLYNQSPGVPLEWNGLSELEFAAYGLGNNRYLMRSQGLSGTIGCSGACP